MYADGVGRLRFLAQRRLQDLVLETGGGHFDTLAFGVLGEEFLTLRLGCTGYLGFQLLEESVEYLLRLLIADLRLLVG